MTGVGGSQVAAPVISRTARGNTTPSALVKECGALLSRAKKKDFPRTVSVWAALDSEATPAEDSGHGRETPEAASRSLEFSSDLLKSAHIPTPLCDAVQRSCVITLSRTASFTSS